MASKSLPLVTDRYAPPPAVGAVFRGPPIGPDRNQSSEYTVAAIVDLGFFDNDPSYYQIVFRFWRPRKGYYGWEVVGADAIASGLYRPEGAEKAGSHV